jgi:putative Holliday junction resolvase
VRHNEEFLGVDVGSARVGIARGSTIAKIAEPIKTVQASQAIDELSTLATQNSTVGIVAGLPRSLSGNETEQTKQVRRWVEEAKKQLDLPFYWQDEALTSQLAEASSGDDSKAAALILQDFLNANETERIRA